MTEQSTAQAHIADTLDRAQRSFDASTDVNAPNFREAVGWFIHHVTAAVLFEHLRRLDPDLADRLVPWLMGADGGIFGDEYAGVLVHQWREQLAAGQPMHPIGPEESA